MSEEKKESIQSVILGIIAAVMFVAAVASGTPVFIFIGFICFAFVVGGIIGLFDLASNSDPTASATTEVRESDKNLGEKTSVLGQKTTEVATAKEVLTLKVQSNTKSTLKQPTITEDSLETASDSRKHEIGLQGELVVLEAEMADLRAQNKNDLAKKVTHVSQTHGDGLGYDIKSYFPDGRKKYIEVKSTATSNQQSIVLTRNELGLLKRKGEQAFVYLVENAESVDPIIKACPGEMFLNTDKYLVTKYGVNIKHQSD